MCCSLVCLLICESIYSVLCTIAWGLIWRKCDVINRTEKEIVFSLVHFLMLYMIDCIQMKHNIIIISHWKYEWKRNLKSYSSCSMLRLNSHNNYYWRKMSVLRCASNTKECFSISSGNLLKENYLTPWM